MAVDYLTYFVIIPVLIAVFLFVFSSSKAARVIAIIFQALFVAFSVWLVMQTRDTTLTTYIGSYDGLLGILLQAGDASAVFVLLTASLFLVVSIYSFHESNQRLFWCLLFLLEGSLVGLFLTRDLFNIFVMVEVSTVVVIILLMYYRHRRNMFIGMIYLMCNIVAMQLFLFGLAYLYMIAGTFDIVALTEIIAVTPREDLIIPYALIMTGIAFKAGFLPLISSVPKVKLYPGAPTGFVAILSGVHAKVGVFLFLQMSVMFGHMHLYDLFLVIGIITALAGTMMAMAANDAKVILAWHTVSQCGLILIGLSAQNDYAMLGGLYHIIAHAIFKSALFLTAGIIRKSYGSMNVYKVRGVLKRMPLVGIGTIVAILGITGAPFFLGSISKYYMGAAVDPWLVWTLRIIAFATIVHFIKYGSMLFGKDPGTTGDEVKPSMWRAVPSFFWGLLCLVGGLFGPHAINFMFSTGVGVGVSEGLLTSWAYYEKALWFLGSVALGLPFYFYVVKGNKVLKKLGKLDFSFKTIVASMAIFLGMLIVFVGFLYT